MRNWSIRANLVSLFYVYGEDGKRFDDETHSMDEIGEDELPVRFDFGGGERNFVDESHLLQYKQVMRA